MMKVFRVAGIENCVETNFQAYKMDKFSNMKILEENRIVVGGLKYDFYDKRNGWERFRLK
jgi:hypothetical protein